MCNLVHENSVKVCEVLIFNKAICTAFRNGGSIQQLLIGRFVCRRSGCSVKWHGKTDTVGCRYNGSYGVRQEKACGKRLSDNDLRTHALHWYVPPSLSRTCTLPSPLAPTVYLQVDVTHICALHTLPSELLKNKRRRAHFILAHTSHTYTITLAANVLWA